MELAKALASSDLLPPHYRGKPANVLVGIGYGHALGLAPLVALNAITVIQGKPTLSAQLQSALVRRAGHRLHVVSDDEKATATLVRCDDPTTQHTATWTLDMARKAGLLNGSAWRQYPDAMLAARATTTVIRNAASDVLLGVAYTPDELGGEVIDVEIDVLDDDGTIPESL